MRRKKFEAGGLSFSQAFRNARNRAALEGEDSDTGTFEWRGKSYSTKMAKAPSRKAAQEAGTRYAATANALRNAPEGFGGVGRAALEREVERTRGEYEKAAGRKPPKAETEPYEYAKGGEVRRSHGGPLRKAAAALKQQAAQEDAEERREKKEHKMAKGGVVRFAKGGAVRCADGCAVRGKTRGRIV